MTEDVALNDEELQRELQSLPGWEIRENWLRRTYKTPGFAHTMLLVNTVGYLA
ncbi:MAG: 4a-hydroxytetrahydrobiopterin dehydratase, partial [Planctomycetaceae bacterium]